MKDLKDYDCVACLETMDEDHFHATGQDHGTHTPAAGVDPVTAEPLCGVCLEIATDTL